MAQSVKIDYNTPTSVRHLSVKTYSELIRKKTWRSNNVGSASTLSPEVVFLKTAFDGSMVLRKPATNVSHATQKHMLNMLKRIAQRLMSKCVNDTVENPVKKNACNGTADKNFTGFQKKTSKKCLRLKRVAAPSVKLLSHRPSTLSTLIMITIQEKFVGFYV